jgi:hypothetical protein
MKRLLTRACLVFLLGLTLGGGTPATRAAEFQSASWAPGPGHAAVLRLPEGTRRVRLQTRPSAAAPWQVVGLTHLAGQAGTLKLRLPDDATLDNLLIETSTTDPFPYTFYQGQSSFAQPSSGPAAPGRDGLFAGGDAAETATSTQSVEESDIWKWRGDTLYYFNTLRGLQVFDLGDTSNPRRITSLRLPAVGEDMYLLGTEHVALLVNRFDYDTGSEKSEIRLLRHAGTALEEVGRVPAQGRFVESRLVGSTLCVVTQWTEAVAGPEPGSVSYQSKSRLHAIDLDDPAAPKSRGSIDIPNPDGSWSARTVLHATSEWLFVATDSYVHNTGYRSWVHAIDLRPASQPLAIGASLPLAGQLLGKFHLSYGANGILTTVSQANGGVVETWDVPYAVLGAQPGLPRPLDSLLVGQGERLFGTRFDGSRVHVVTFRVIDPLFCVDIGNPRDLRLLGELEVPGFSTYLEAFADGTRLLSLGVEDSRVAVSLFDVADPSRPTLRARLRFGDEQHWSWSEGNYDDKAIGFFRDQHLMVFPLSAWTPDQGYRQGMQLVDATADGLRERGFVAHRFNARRARLLDTALVSISGSELIVVDIADRDAPRPLATLDIAWSVDHVVPNDEVLVQFESGDGYRWAGSTEPPRPARLRVSPKNDPDAPLATLDLGAHGQVVGTARRGSTVHVLLDQTEQREIVDPADPAVRQWETARVFTAMTIDLADPAAPRVLGSARNEKSDTSWGWGGGEMTAHWLPDGRLLWYPPQTTGGYWFRCFACAVDGPVASAGLARDIAWPWWGGGAEDFLVVEVADPASPKVLVREPLLSENQEAGAGRAFVSADNRLLTSWSSWRNQTGAWTEESRAQEIDLSDSAAPRRGPIASLSGPLQGLHRTNAGGTILFTVRPEIVSTPDRPLNWTGHALVEALAFDGTQAFRLDGVRAEYSAHFSAVVSGPHVLLPRPRLDGEKKLEAALHVIAWNDSTGTLRTLDPLPLDLNYPSVTAQGGFVFASGATAIEVIAAHQLPDPPTRTRFDFGIPFWSGRPTALDPAAREAWRAAGPYGVDRLDLSALPFPATPVLRAPRDATTSEWSVLALSPLDIVPAHATEHPGPLPPDAEFAFVADSEAESFDAWSLRWFGESVDPSADHDGDGFGAYTEWAFGSSPRRGDAIPRVDQALLAEDGKPPRPVLIARLHPQAQTTPDAGGPSLQLVPQVSGDLVSWSALAPEAYDRLQSVGRCTLVLPALSGASSSVFTRLEIGTPSSP